MSVLVGWLNWNENERDPFGDVGDRLRLGCHGLDVVEVCWLNNMKRVKWKQTLLSALRRVDCRGVLQGLCRGFAGGCPTEDP